MLWPSGRSQSFENVPFDRVLELREGTAEPIAVASSAFRLKQTGGGHGHHASDEHEH